MQTGNSTGNNPKGELQIMGECIVSDEDRWVSKWNRSSNNYYGVNLKYAGGSGSNLEGLVGERAICGRGNRERDIKRRENPNGEGSQRREFRGERRRF